MQSEAWSAERVDLLRRLWADGETAAAIAVRLGGMSRSAVLGKVFRLRLADPVSGKTAQEQRSAAAPALNAEWPYIARRRRSPKRAHQQQPSLNAAKRGKTLLELTNNTCRSAICGAAPKTTASSTTAGTPKTVPRLPRWRKSSITMPIRWRRCAPPSRRWNYHARSSRRGPRSASPASSSSVGSSRAR
jgi:hypothetical protein